MLLFSLVFVSFFFKLTISIARMYSSKSLMGEEAGSPLNVEVQYEEHSKAIKILRDSDGHVYYQGFNGKLNKIFCYLNYHVHH